MPTVGRAKPYTYTGLRRLKCAKCKERQATCQWSTACANGNRWVPLCTDCDISLNALVLKWLGIADLERMEIIKNYRKRMEALDGGL